MTSKFFVWPSKPEASVQQRYAYDFMGTAVVKSELTNGKLSLKRPLPTVIFCPGRGSSLLQAEPLVMALVPHDIMVVSYDPPVSVVGGAQFSRCSDDARGRLGAIV